MDENTLDKAIDAVFGIFEDLKKVEKLNEFQGKLGFGCDFFSFNSFLDINQNRLVDFLDWYFYGILGDFHPESEFGGIVSYTLYDAATPYIDGKPYNLKDKDDFRKYILDSVAPTILTPKE